MDRHLDFSFGGAAVRPVASNELAKLIADFAWDKTSLGTVAKWPQSLKTAIGIMLTSRQPIWIGWGPELIYFYNDPYKSIIGGKHPWALGRPTSEVWKEIWPDIGPMLAQALDGSEGTYVEAQLLIMERNGYPEETYYTFSIRRYPTITAPLAASSAPIPKIRKGSSDNDSSRSSASLRPEPLTPRHGYRHATCPSRLWGPTLAIFRSPSFTSSIPKVNLADA